MRRLPAPVYDTLTRATSYRCHALKSYKVPPSSAHLLLNKPSSYIMNHTYQAKQPLGSKEYRVVVKKRHSSAKYFLSLKQPQSTTSERFFVKQPQISYRVRAGYLGLVYKTRRKTVILILWYFFRINLAVRVKSAIKF